MYLAFLLKGKTMIVERVINNNIISSLDESGKEMIVMGRGIGFGTKAGLEIDTNKIEKVFRLDNHSDTEKFKDLLVSVPIEQAEMVDDIILYAKEKIRVKLNSNVYVTLTDHISFALERQKANIAFENPLLWEIQRYYPTEYEVGLYACDLILKRFGISLPQDEAGFIALHIVNSEYRTSIREAVKFPSEIRTILELIKHDLQIEFDETSLDYERLLTHVKFLLQRLYRKELLQEEDVLIGETVKKQYPRAYACSEKIASYLKEATGVVLPGAEMTYMTIHIRRVLNSRENKNV